MRDSRGAGAFLLTLAATTLVVLSALATPESVPPAQQSKATAQQLEFFEKQVRPILVENCYACHSASSTPLMGGLRLDSRASILKGGDRGASVVLGQPDKSMLIKAVAYHDPKMQMPPKGRLKDEQIAALTEWVKMGAPWPTEARPVKGQASKVTFDLQGRRAAHWAWKPVKRPNIPVVKNRIWPRGPIDSFVLAKLESAGLKPNPGADKLTLIRRVTFDLIGLPPTPTDIDAFLKDNSPDAYSKVVDRLLASPQYGERWARHWLDLVRYAETDGHEFDFEKPGVFRYRDYVIRAFNADLPYNQFVKEHVAGDLLKNPRRDQKDGFNESVIGTGFWWLGEGKHSPVDITQEQRDIIDNQMDVFGKAFMGLTIGCAKCHNHKFDAISAKDYYALTGFLKSSRYHLADIDSPSRNRPVVEELAKLSDELQARAAGSAERPVLQPGSAEIFEDFTKQTFQNWETTGEAFGSGPTPAVLALKENGSNLTVEKIGASAADSGRFGDRLEGTLRSQTFTLTKPYVYYHMAGSGGAKVNLIIDGFQRIRYPIYGGLEIVPKTDSKLSWQVMDVTKWVGHRAYVEFLDYGTGKIACDVIAFSDKSAPQEAPKKSSGSVKAVSVEGGASAAGLLSKRNELEGKLTVSTRVLALADGTGENDRVHLRGNHATLGDEVPRRFLEACAGANQPPVTGSGSGRLELAERITSPSDTLLARVMVNRIWQHHFGEGIVRSVDDFGVMGQLPTHPELLDWLASEFVHQGWSIKKMHRMILLSSTYRMSSHASPQADKVDPTNKLLHRMFVRRLEAEPIRDAILAVSGRLDTKMFGPPEMPYLTPFMEGRGRPDSSGPLDGAGRRSIYVGVRRNFLVPMFLAFDYPVPATCMGRRSVSNVPAQALTLMNNPFVLQQADVWAKRILTDKAKTTEQRIENVYLSAFGRPPTPKEAETAIKFLQAQNKQYSGDELKSWTDFCHVVFNVKEFIFVN